jgi:hypothetical protein
MGAMSEPCVLGEDCAAKEFVKNERGQYPPDLILDDFSSFRETEKGFVVELAQWALKQRVPVFIMKDTKEVAYDICQQNGMSRIQPLPNQLG